MFIKFSEEAQKILKKAKVEMNNLHHAFIGSEHLILSILHSDNNLCHILNKYHITYDIYKEELIKIIGLGKAEHNYLIYTPLLRRVLANAIIDSSEANITEVSLENIFLALLDEGEGVGIRILNKLHINIDELYQELCTTKKIVKDKKKLSIYEYGLDLTKEAKENKLDPLIGREEEVNRLLEILCRKNKNNPLLIGEAGVGKTAIVEGLAKRLNDKMVPDNLVNYKIISLSMSSLVAGTKYRGEFEERINKLLKETENSNIILFIDEIHTIVGAGGAEGAIDASNIIKPALARGKIRLIGATTINEYKDTISKDKALARRFQTIMVKEPNMEKTKDILLKIKNIYENYHHVLIDDMLIEKLVLLTNKYLIDRKNPDKSIDILDEVCSRCSLKKNKNKVKVEKLHSELKSIKENKNNLLINKQFTEAYLLKNKELLLEDKLNKLAFNNNRYKITLKDILEVIKEKANIPNCDSLTNNIKRINKLNKYLKTKIIGQDRVIDELTNITKKNLLGLRKSNLPISLLFQGSSGVGKTMLVKEYANYLDIPLIRLDMSEYKESHTISKIIGSPPGYIGYDNYDNVLEKVRNNPYSVILLDEIEKASLDVINLFFQILDEGKMTDSHGSIVDFSHTIIFMTSNIGSREKLIGFNENNYKYNDLVKELPKEFVNRLEKVLVFNNLTYNDVLKIVNNKIEEIKAYLKENDLFIKINRHDYYDLIKKVDFSNNGVRKLLKNIENKIDDLIIDNLDNKVISN